MKQSMEERVASSTSTPSPYMGLQEAADYCCASYSTFRQWTGKRLLPSYKVGKRVLYKTVDLEAFIEKHLRRSHEQLDKALVQRQQALNNTTSKAERS
jgi:excisionase family DNA binding protein